VHLLGAINRKHTARFVAPATDRIGCNVPELTEFFRREMTLERAYN
jgi:hypothetical protein